MGENSTVRLDAGWAAVRNPDVVCMEHFIKAAKRGGVTVLLAGARPDLPDALARLRFGEWLPADGVFCQHGDEDSATLAAIRFVHPRIGKKPGEVCFIGCEIDAGATGKGSVAYPPQNRSKPMGL